MQKLNVDLGILEYEICGRTLRINPSDPNLYDRFVKASKEILELEENLAEKTSSLPDGEENGMEVVRMMREADTKTKDLLNRTFGLDNDFEEILQGVNLMAVGTNGERIVTNLLNALIPIVEKGVKTFRDSKVNAALSLAKANRAQRRAAAKGK